MLKISTRARQKLLIIATAVAFSTACKESSTPPTSNPRNDPSEAAIRTDQTEKKTEQERFDDEKKKFLKALEPLETARAAQTAIDRRELVLPPPTGWKPDNIRRKLKLILIPEKTQIRRGENFRYRLEIRNMGQDPFTFVEMTRSFIKTGSLAPPTDFHFHATTPDGKDAPLYPPLLVSSGILQWQEYHFPDAMTPSEKEDEFEKIKLKERAESELIVPLQPGETLISHPDAGSPNGFRDLRTRFDFDKPGTYRIKVRYGRLPPPPPSEEHIQALIKKGISREEQLAAHKEWMRDRLGLLESNTVAIEVVR